MDIYSLPPFLVSLLGFILGAFVLLRKSHATVNRIFFLESVSVSLWLFFDFLMFSTSSIEQAGMWARYGYVPVFFIAPFFYQFAYAFIGKKAPKSITLLLYGITTLWILLTLKTDYIIRGAVLHYWGYYPIVGSFHFIFMGYLMFVFVMPL